MIKNIIASIVVSLVISVAASAFIPSKTPGKSLFGSTIETIQVTFGGGLKVGASGSSLTQVLKGSCVLLANASIAATSSAPVDCAVTGVKSGDTVFMTLATTTNTIAGGWAIRAAKASTTAGYITGLLYNGTGASAVPSASGVGSSTSYLIIR